MLFRSIFTYQKMELPEVIRELNDRVMSSAMGEKYITFFIGIFNCATRTLRYINCGHNPPILVRKSGDVEHLNLGSIGLGMFEEIPRINEGTLSIGAQDVLVCYTDGLVELENNEQEEFGMDKLAKLIQNHLQDSSGKLNSIIMTTLETYRGEMPYIDDTAVLTCKFL